MSDLYRILVVDDDYGQAEMLKEFLRLSGFSHVEQAHSIASLWEHLEANHCDIVLLDYKLPDGTGLDALGEFNRRGYQVPVVMVTGQGDERVAVQAIQRGATDYLLKSGDYLVTLPALIRKTVRSYQLQLSVQRSLEQIRYQATLLNNVRDAIVVWDIYGKITYWSIAATLLFGYSAEERLGCSVAEAYLSAFNPPITLPKEGDTIGHHIERQCQVKGRTIWVSSRITALYDAQSNNRLIGYMDVSYDITKRKEAEQALRAERNFVSAILDTVGALVVVLDRQGQIVRFNRACEQITGYLFTEVRGKPVWDLFPPPEERDAVRALFERIHLDGFPNEHENHWTTRSGSRRLIAWSNTAITGRHGQVEYVIATGLDITERRQAEQGLRESEARYRAIVDDYQTELICRFTPDGQLTFVNEVFCQYFGKGRDELIGTCILDFLSSDDRTAVVKHLASFHPAKPVASSEHRIRLPSREIRWHHWTDRAIYDSQGQLFEFQSVARDITERKQMESQIQAAQTHLVQAARLATIGEMASGVAHQINNPLTTIIAESQILRRTLIEGEPGRDSAEAIEQAGWRLQEAVLRLVEFSRPASTTLEAVSINATIEQALKLVGAHIEASGITLTKNLADGLPNLRGNARQLEDLWVNLLLLARDAASNGSGHAIQVRSRLSQPGTILVEVCDNGIPIPPDQLAAIFEPNFIGPSSGRGTGMELSICREIVRQHDGQISAESSIDRDTMFRVVFPVEIIQSFVGSKQEIS